VIAVTTPSLYITTAQNPIMPPGAFAARSKSEFLQLIVRLNESYIHLFSLHMAMKPLLLILFIPLLLSAQDTRKKMLVVPLFEKHIKIKGIAARCIRYNNITEAAVAHTIFETTLAKLSSTFSDWELIYIHRNAVAAAIDTSYELRLRNRFYYDAKDSSYHMIIKHTPDSYHSNYYACELNENGKSMLKEAIQKSGCDYVLFINEFEIINPGATFSISSELMDKNMKKIYGNKNELRKEVGRTMYYDVFEYYLKEVADNLLKNMKEYIDGMAQPKP
jgi:hypothetical protein